MQNLRIQNIAVHEVSKRNEAEDHASTILSNNVVTLDPRAKRALEARIINSLGSQSHSVELDIELTNEGSTFQLSQASLGNDDARFIEASRSIAQNLGRAQVSRSIPGGIIVIFSGTVNHPAQEIVGIIKAEANTGFTKDNDDHGNLVLNFIDNLFLTAQSRLYKIGLFVDPNMPDTRQALVYDENVKAKEPSGAAKYFYEVFLGCRLPQNNAKQTKEFFMYTRDYINNLVAEDDRKMDLHTGLYTYLRVDVNQTIQSNEFARSYFEDNERDAYLAYMNRRSFPARAIPKDTSHILTLLRRRRLKFRSNIQLTAPTDVFDERVTYKVRSEDDGEKSTIITIRDQLMQQP